METKEEKSRDLFAAVTSAATAALPAASALESRFSPHAAQLSAGFRWLRFAPALEREFRAFYHDRFLIRTRIALIGGALLLALFSLRDIRVLPAEVWQWTVGLRLGVMVPAIGAVLALSFVRRLASWFETLTAFGVTAVMGALAAALILAERMGAPLPYTGLLAIMVFAIFLGGLRFYHATVSTLLAAVGYLAARVALDLPDAATVEQGYYIAVITLIGLVGSYSLELSLRANFLTEHIAVFRATRDALTHLHNRRAALDHLDRAWRLAFRERRPLAIVLIDVDQFKRYNDHYGHSQGDACLARLAVVLGERVRRPMDMVARYGGEEFIVILYDVTEPMIRRICEDVRLAVARMELQHEHNPPHGLVTVSVGAAWALPASGGATFEAVIEAADAALYRAKAAGRNRVELQPPRRISGGAD